MREFGVRPKRDLGQNFLVDSNILGVIERAAELDPDDVVLEIGGGLGVLSEHLAPRCAHVHVVELDRALEPALRDALAPLRQHDAARRRRDDARPRGARPRADEGRRQPALRDRRRRRSCARSRSCRRSTRWVAMVQKEVGERFAAAPGDRRLRRAVGARPARLRRARAARPVSRTVFHPVPNVDSVLVVLERTGAGAAAGAARARAGRVRPPPQGARRARWRWPPGAPAPTCASARARRSRRSAIRPTCAPSGCAGGASARSPERCAHDRRCASARPAKINLCLFLGPTRRRRPPRARHGHAAAVARATRCALEPAPSARRATRSSAPASTATTSPPPRCARSASATGWDGAPVRHRRSTSASRSRPAWRGGSADAAAALRLAARAAGRRRRRRCCARSPPGSAPTCRRRCGPGRVLATGAGERLQPLPGAAAATACSIVPLARTGSRPPTSSARPTASACRATPPGSARARWPRSARAPARPARRAAASTT